MTPMQNLSLDGGIMPPSPVSGNSSRHGRSKHGGSVAKKGGRGRGYSVVEDREALISKALTFVLKRTIKEGEKQEEGTEEKLVADADGWVDCEDVVRLFPLPRSTPLTNTFTARERKPQNPRSNIRGTPLRRNIAEIPLCREIEVRFLRRRSRRVRLPHPHDRFRHPFHHPLRQLLSKTHTSHHHH
jgi:hypothetical protein